jgi:putative DNA primase/helicase
MNPPTLETIRTALDAIPPDSPRDEWARVAMALKSELGEAGFELFDTWSQRGETYNAKATRETWRSVKPGGGVKIGSLLHLAKAHGWRPEPGERKASPSADELKAQREARAVREQREAAERDKAQRDAAAEALRHWEAASESGASPYLVRKGVQGHGVRYAVGGWLLVPMRDAAGELWNVQRIAPSRPADGPEKLFLKGGRKSGLWHAIGEWNDAPAILVCEGYATGASLHEATGRPVAVAFDAGNVPNVARELRRLRPAAWLALCADDDRETEAKTGRNPGRDKAHAAAKTIRKRVAVILPAGLPEGASDFNDMANAAGLEAVREHVEAALAAAMQARQQGAGEAARGEHAQESEAAPAGRDSSGSGPGAGWLDRFEVNAEGVWFREHDSEGRPKAPLWVCTRLEVPALTRDADGQGWGYLLEFADPAGNARQWAMPARMLAGDGNEFRGVLMAFGLRIAAASRARALLAQFIQTRQPGEHARCADRIGWHGAAFVLPRETLGDAGERIVFQTDGTVENTFRQRGTLAHWRERVARPCVGNSRLAFAVACAFAGPMMRPGGIDSGGFHLRGDSSSGKTTALRVAASVYGGPSYMQRWRATDNALEAIAAAHCDGLLILDELAQVDAKTAGECAYMLANETSKARSTRTGQARPRLTWRLLFLSAGEIGLAQHMAEGGKRARAGQELRMADVPADAGAGRGIFEELHGHENGATFAQYLAKASESQHGTAGRAFLEWAVAHADTLRDRMRDGIERLARLWVHELASGQVQRVGRRFAAVAVAGELASEAGITGWPDGEATRAAKACFNAWLDSRGGIGNAEERAMLRQVRRCIESDGEARFTPWDRLGDDHAPKTMHRLGVRRPVKDSTDPTEIAGWEFYFFIESFRGEVCEGFDWKAVLRVLRERGYLVPDKGRPFDCKPRLPGIGPTACYRVLSSILDADGDD